MKKFITYIQFSFAIILLLNSCATTKRAYLKGNYYVAAQRAIKHLQKNPNHAYQVDYLFASFIKHKQQILQKINLLEAENTASNAEVIWQEYARLQSLQNSIQVLLPLKSTQGNAMFAFENYTNAIVENKKTTIDYLYSKAENLCNKQDRFSAREAITYLNKIKSIQPNYLQTNEMLFAATDNATTYVQVQPIPSFNPIVTNISLATLEKIAANKLHTTYIDYYTTTATKKQAHYIVNYTVTNYQESPNKETEKTIVQSKNKVISVLHKKDANGKTLKDKQGNIIMDTVFEKINCTILHTNLYKNIQFTVEVQLLDAITGKKLSKVINTITDDFEYNYATYKGDADALTDEQKIWIKNKKINFPTNKKTMETLVAKNAASIEDWLLLDVNKRLVL